MKRNFLHLLSNNNALININGNNIGAIDSSNPQIDIISNTNNLFITYSPIYNNAHTIPYTFALNTNETPYTDNEYIKIVPFPNNHYDIIMTPFYYYQISQSHILFNDNVGKYFVTITSNTSTQITIYEGTAIVFTLTTVALNKAIVKQKKDFIIIEGIIDESTYQLIIINSNDFSIIYNNTTHSVEENNYHITCFRKLNTICKHAEVSSLDFETKQKDKYYVYESEVYSINPSLIPLAFLECIKVGDEDKAKSFLADNLSNTSIIQLQEYFGNMKEIFINRHNITPYKQNYTIETNKMKNYNFLLENQKIIDIEEVF